MTGRQTRRNCPFCQHPRRDEYEQNVRIGLLEVGDLDRDQSWAEGTAHRHMRRHSGEYHNASNSECPICTHPERSAIEAAVLGGIAGIADMAVELEMTETAVSHHMERHAAPIIQRQAQIENIPNAITSVSDAMRRTERNLNRLNDVFNDHMDLMNAERVESGILDFKGLDTAVKLHREIRDTLSDLAEYLTAATTIEESQQVNVLTVIQAHFSEKSPEEWRVLRNALTEAGVLDEG